MSSSLPEHASLEWLRKTAKQSLKRLRAQRPHARLADVQRILAREYGFDSWRQLIHHIQQLGPEQTPHVVAKPDEAVVQSFFKFVGTGQIDEVSRLLHQAPELVNAVGPHPFWGGRPQALHIAIETKRREVFSLLLEAGADINGSNDQYDGWSPLMLAIQRNHTDMRDELIRRGAGVGLVDALMMGDDSRTESLLQSGGVPTPAETLNGGSVLNFARTTYAIDRLIAAGASMDLKDRWGKTPLEAFSDLGERGYRLVKHLSALGVRASAVSQARIGDTASLSALFEVHPDLVRADEVLMAAVESRNLELTKWLLERGASANARTGPPTYRTALHAAAWNADLATVRILVDAGAELDTRDEQYGSTAQQWAETAVTIRNDPNGAIVARYLAERAFGR